MSHLDYINFIDGLRALENNLQDRFKGFMEPNCVLRSIEPTLEDEPWQEVPKQDKEAFRPYREPSQKHNLDNLARCFYAIEASPKKKAIFEKIYKYPLIDESLRDEIPTNASSLFTIPEASKVYIANAEHLERDLPEELCFCAKHLEKNRTRCFIITGEKGSGKTAFINNLLSRYQEDFESNKIVVVRLSLVARTAMKMGLIKSLELQAGYIFLDYYLDGGRKVEESEVLLKKDLDALNKLSDKRKNDLSKVDFFKFIKNNSVESLVRPGTIDVEGLLADHNLLYDEKDTYAKIDHMSLFRSFAKSKGYRFVYFIDGLDESSVYLVRNQALRRWSDDLKAIINNKRCAKGLYFLCARHESLTDLQDKISYSGNKNTLNIWKIIPPDFDEVFKARKELISIKIRGAKHNKNYALQVWSERAALGFVDLVMVGIRDIFSHKGIADLPLQEIAKSGYLRALLRYLSRAVLECGKIINDYMAKLDFKGTISDFIDSVLDEKNSERDLNDEIVKKAYRFWKIERLVFSYTENDSVEVLQSHDGLKAAQPKDLPAFPLIPVPWGDIPFKKKLPGYNNNYLLSQIQILQILEQQENREAGVKRIIYTMAKCFGYHEHHIAVIIRIMVLKRMLVFPSKENPLIGFRECRICLSTIGRYVIENWINEISYTETTMQFSRIPRNKKLSRRFVKFPIFRAKYPKSVQDDSYIDEDFIYVEEEGSTTLQDYLANLYWYLPRFICLVEAMENWSHVAWQFYDANFSSYDETLRLKFEFRPIASQLKNSAIDSNRKCLSTMVYGLRSNYDEKAAPVKDFRAKVLLSIAERFGYPIPTEIKRRLYLPNVLDRYRHRI